jgi:hypothetical protein
MNAPQRAHGSGPDGVTRDAAPASDLITPLMTHSLGPMDLGAGQAIDWEKLLGQARTTRLAGRLATMQAQGHTALAAMPEAPRRFLQGVEHLLRRQQQEVHWELDRLSRALLPAVAPVVLLKGAAYLAIGLPSAGSRLFADIDILVPKSQLDQAEGLLMAAGWVSREHDAYTQHYYRAWSHELPPLTHLHRQTVIDLHHTITAPISRFAVPGEELLRHAVPLPDWPGLFVLQPVDMVLHSAAHLFQEGEFDHGLRDVLDMRDLLLHFAKDAGFWPALFTRAAQLKLQVPLYHALVQLGRLCASDTAVPGSDHRLLPPHVTEQVAALPVPWSSRVLMTALLARALRPVHPSCVRPGDALARFALYLRSHWLRMPMHMVLPHLVRKAWMRHKAAKTGPQP